MANVRYVVSGYISKYGSIRDDVTGLGVKKGRRNNVRYKYQFTHLSNTNAPDVLSSDN